MLKLTAQQRDDAVYWVHRRGLSAFRVAKSLGVNHGTILGHVRRHRTELPTDYEPVGPPPPPLPPTRYRGASGGRGGASRSEDDSRPLPTPDDLLTKHQAAVLANDLERHGWRAEAVQCNFGGAAVVEVRDLTIRWTPIVARLRTAAQVDAWLAAHPHGLRGRVPTTADYGLVPEPTPFVSDALCVTTSRELRGRVPTRG